MKIKKLLFAIMIALGAAAIVTANTYLQISKAKNQNREVGNQNQGSSSSNPEPKISVEDSETAQSPAGTGNQTINQNSNVASDQRDRQMPPGQKAIVEPISGMNDRVWLNPFGNVPSKMTLPKDKDYSDLTCKQGRGYAGYHTGADFEINKDEKDKPVLAKAIASGVIRQIGPVNGYGGLIVEEIQIDGKAYTVYYGHVDLDTATVKTGDKVAAGQKLVELAPACSVKNGYTRKHLHLGIHKGTGIEVAGYVTNKNLLVNWVDPKEIIK